jgi:hypothetical protein
MSWSPLIERPRNPFITPLLALRDLALKLVPFQPISIF